MWVGIEILLCKTCTCEWLSEGKEEIVLHRIGMCEGCSEVKE